MPRIYIDSTKGTGGLEVVDLDPNPPIGTPGAYHWLDGIVDGTLLTQKIRQDPFRPTNDPVGPNVNIPIMDSRLNGDSYFIVMDAGTNVAPAGTIDLGAPGNTLDEIMPQGKADEIRALLGLTLEESTTMASNRIRKAVKWLRFQGTKGSEDEFVGLPGNFKYRLWQAAD